MTDQELSHLEGLEEALRSALKFAGALSFVEGAQTCIENALAAILPKLDAEYARRWRARKEGRKS